MVYLAIILSLIFIVLAITVIGKSSSLSKAINNEEKSTEEYTGNTSANKWNGFGFMVFFILGTIGGVLSFIDSMPQMFKSPASIHGVVTDNMFWISMSVVTFAFFVTSALLFWFSYKYSFSKNRVAKFYPENHKLELVWTIIPAVIMAGLVFTGWKAWTDIMGNAPKDSVEIEVVGHQFAWDIRYAGSNDNKLGNYNYKLIDDTNILGLDLTDENTFDDFTTNTDVHIPKGVPVLLKIRAKDVLHSVFMPDMRLKMDAVPGMPTKFWFTATKTTDEIRAERNDPEYNYRLNCTEICGNGHFSMKVNFIVDEKEDYDKWVAAQKSWLSQNPEYLAKVPEKLKAKAMKYIQGPTPVDSSTVAGVTLVKTAALK